MFHEDLMRGFKSEAFSRAMVELVHGDGNTFRGNGTEVELFREELSNEPVHVFICPALPRGIGMREEIVCTKVVRDLLVVGKLFSVVGRDRMHRLFKRRQQGHHRVGYGSRFFAVDMGNQGVTRAAFVQGNKGLFVPSTDHQVSLPITKSFACINNGRAQVNGSLIRDRASSLMNTVSFPPCFLTAQGQMEDAAAPLVTVYPSVD